jgi:ubiquitin carboxyl-terminal hydrolase L5
MANEDSSAQWCLIESDPGVFSELLRGYGVLGVQVEEVISLDKDTLSLLKPVYGLIFLFKCDDDKEKNSKLKSSSTATLPSGGTVLTGDMLPHDVFFARQVVHNACATYAIANLVGNLGSAVADPPIELGDIFHRFLDFTATMDPLLRGQCLGNEMTFRQVHNSFARQYMFEFERAVAEKEDEEAMYHFIGYMPIRGRLYELDGCNPGPIDHGPVAAGSDWLDAAVPIIEKRIALYSDGEIRFSLLALVADRKLAAIRRLEQIQSFLQNSEIEPGDNEAAEITRLQESIQEEEEKRQKYQVENIRRRHNYLPLIVSSLRALARAGRLVELVGQAQKKALERKKKELAKKREKHKEAAPADKPADAAAPQ